MIKRSLPMLPTTIIGSYPKPRELKAKLDLFEKGLIDRAEMEKALQDAVRSVVRDHEHAGIDILWDGEMSREEMTSYFAERINGFRFYGEVRVWGNNYYKKPSIIDEFSYNKELAVNDFLFLRSITSKAIKVPITGPYTIVDWSFNEFYKSKEDAVYALARILNKELRRLVDAGADYIQLDEPAIPTHPEEFDIARNAIEIVTRGVKCYIGLHMCYGDYSLIYPMMLELKVDQFALEFANKGFKEIRLFKEHEFTKDLGFGCIDVHTREIEKKEEVKKRILEICDIIGPKKVYVNPDCGLKLLSREIALAKLKLMCEAAKEARAEVGC